MAASSASPPTPRRLARGRRYAVRGLLALATVLAVLSVVAVWANRQLLNAENWADTSTALLEDPAIRTSVSDYLVDAVYANVDVSAQLASALPPRLQPLAGPAAGGLRNAAQDVTERALGRPRVQQAWKNANRLAAERFIAIAEDKSTFVTTSGSAVYLDLRALLLDVVERLGLPGKLAGRIPPSAGSVRIMSSDQVSAIQDATSTLRGLAVALPLLALALFALAVGIARGRRRETLRSVGWCLVIAGALVLVARTVAGQRVVDSLARTDAVKPAAEATWSIGTSMLHDIAWAVIVVGIPLIAAAWLAGPMRSAHVLRGAAAPWLRERPGVAYGLAAALVLLVIAWAPIPATRMVIPVLLMIALVVLGVAALRRQVAAEFPAATVADAQARWRARTSHAWQTARAAGRRDGAGTPGVPAGDGTPALGAAQRVALLERLAALHERGVIGDEELAAQKAALLEVDRT
jgi:hypothetical protein